MRKAAAFLAAILGTVFLSGAVAQTTQPTLVPTVKVKGATLPAPPVSAQQGTHALTADDINAWLDGYMPYAIAKGDIPGAVVVVVKDGQ
ncbi:MAG TPA: serine hydrolase, partial [Sphingomicrobium sp.]|nr:serine hydrolase [Sphingomicrobium sp.]